jgi:hypothetical protein
MIHFCGSNMTKIIFFLFLFHLVSCIMPEPIMDNIVVEPPLEAINLAVQRSLIPELSFSAINCNSLNMGTVTKHARLRKFYGIASLKTDIVFLSDIRMCNKNGTADLKFIAETFAVNPYCSYSFLHQSTKNSRGVGLLYKKIH